MWIKLKQIITRWMWGYNDWFKLMDRMDEIRKDIQAGIVDVGDFEWDCSAHGGGWYKVTIEAKGAK